MNNNDIHIDNFGDWQRAPQMNSSGPSLNQIDENNRLYINNINNINNIMIYSKLEKLESDIEQIKNILMRIYLPQPINYQMQPSLFTGHNIPFMQNINKNNNNNNINQLPLF
jgi:hypothetical protein